MLVNNLVSILWTTFIFFTLLCLVLCIQAHYRYKKKTGIDNDDAFLKRYEYFGQPVYNQNEHHSGRSYELLLREFNTANQRWQLPQNVANFPLSKIVQTIQHIDFDEVQPLRKLALNMTVSQIVDYHANYFFTWVLGIVDVQQLVVEIDMNDINKLGWIKRHQFRHSLKKLQRTQVQIAIENVDSSAQTYKSLRQYLPYIDYLKFNINAFNKSATNWIDITLAQWQRQCASWNVQVIVGKIETSDHKALVDQLKIGLRQGYVYGQPEMLNHNMIS